MTLYTSKGSVGSFALSGNAFIDSLFSPDAAFRTKWTGQAGGSTQISYSFVFLDGFASKFAPGYGSEPTATQHFGVTAAQIPGIDLAFQRWADVANVKFTKVTEDAAGNVGDIRIGFSSSVSPDFWGYTQWIGYGAGPAHGDIWIEPSIKSGTFQPFTYDFTAMMHEIGHALGLDHPFEGNIIPAGYDDARYTIMSYTQPKGNFYFPPGSTKAQYLIITPMVYDIAAVQKIYGANMSYHTGDDVYAFKPSQPVYQTIWDAGGNDTLDITAFTKGCTISLVAGTYSQLTYSDMLLDANIGIAFNCTIENARGGSGNDTITGNEVANTLFGNGGADKLSGGAGNDSLDGGAGDDTEAGGDGNDTFYAGTDGGKDVFDGGNGFDTIYYGKALAAVTVDLAARTAIGTASGDTAGIGSDTFVSIEAAIGSAFNDTLLGSAGGDLFIGGPGDDLIDGRGGTDTASYANANGSVTVNLTLTGPQNTVSAGSDTLISIEAVNGSIFDDTIIGNSGSNVLSGGAGNDQLQGGAGRDIVTGGAGADTFRFASGDFAGMTTATCDLIADFSHAEGDRIDLSAIDANSANGTGNDAFAFIGSAAFGHIAGQLRVEVISGLSVVQGDVNGDGVADFWIGLNGAPALVAGDFVL